MIDGQRIRKNKRTRCEAVCETAEEMTSDVSCQPSSGDRSPIRISVRIHRFLIDYADRICHFTDLVIYIYIDWLDVIISTCQTQRRVDYPAILIFIIYSCCRLNLEVPPAMVVKCCSLFSLAEMKYCECLNQNLMEMLVEPISIDRDV